MKHQTYPFILFLSLSLLLSLNINAQQGNVGIGITDPQAKLHVGGDMQVDDLAGEGERTLVATPDGKIKVITNTTTDNNICSDTLTTQYIEMTDDEGDIRFILNGQTGEFQMLDDDTTWYALEVKSPLNNFSRLASGFDFILRNPEDIATLTQKLVEMIPDHPSLSTIQELLEEGNIEHLEGNIIGGENEEGTAQFMEEVFAGIYHLSLTAPTGEFAQIDLFIEDIEGTLEIRAAYLDGFNFLNFFHFDTITEAGTTETTIATKTISSHVVDITQTKDSQGNSTNEPIVSHNFGLNENNQFEQTTKNHLTNIQRTKTAEELTFTHTETGNTASMRIDENGEGALELTTDGNQLKITGKEFVVTKAGQESISADIKDIIGMVDKSIANQASIAALDQQNQIHADEIATLSEQAANQATALTDLDQTAQAISDELDALGEGGEIPTTATEYVISNDTHTNTISATKNTYTAPNNQSAEFGTDGLFFFPNATDEFKIDFNGLEENIGSGNVKIDLDADNSKLIVDGDLEVQGTITEFGKKVTLLPHPTDPNQHIAHAGIYSDELLNKYKGKTTTNDKGYALVELPEYIEDFHTDFRYQLTVIGTFAQAIIAKEIQNHTFVIRTDQPNVKVSWQITGVRTDAYAQQNPLQVEIPKSTADKGTLLYDSTTKTFRPTLLRKEALMGAMNGSLLVD